MMFDPIVPWTFFTFVCVLTCRYIHLTDGRDDTCWIGGCQLDRVDHVRHAVHDRCTVLRWTGHVHTAVGRRLHVPVRRIRTSAGVPLLVGRYARVCVRMFNLYYIRCVDVQYHIVRYFATSVLGMHTLLTASRFEYAALLQLCRTSISRIIVRDFELV